MTRHLVLDASAAIAIVRAEKEAEAIRRTIDGWKRAGGTVLVPDIFWLEVVNALARRYRWPGADVLQAIHELDSLDLSTAPSHRPLLLTSLDLVERFGLTAYDATYLALAMTSDAVLLSLDRQLVEAAGDRALSLDDGHRLHETPAVYEHDVTWPSYARASSYLAELRARAKAAAEPT
jgi:predicted nucleic acid-binding protein